ncbi:hypothetical protein GGR21_001411 [Dysgonomonas hofstadii]|uniref:Interferon-induced transmembrane protein n=1 Tax=Dysgonomonas hofstadii TaxID=637886 RepID=A0A840CN84_9BACT|nr:CD225/dispanin family protein [Dysgonomonas hofstadii]MBB4035518.1 hypothetical protein [Dysgonomonas hofstadii]
MSEYNQQETQEPQESQFSSFQSSNTDGPIQPIKPDNNLVLSIISAVVGLCSPCCIGLILGIIAIVFSTQVDSKYTVGDYRGSESAAKTAKILALIAIGLFVLNAIYAIVMFATGGMDAALEQYKMILDQIQ